jgi:hypothetical protein
MEFFMSEEVIAAAAAPEVTETAAVTEAPVSGEQKPELQEEQKAEKSFSQAELDAIVAKRLAKEQRKWQREVKQRVAQVQPEPPKEPQGKPQMEQFSTTEDYVEAVAAWKAEQIITQREGDAQKQSKARAEQDARERARQTFEQRAETVREKHEDYDDVVLNPQLPITDAMAMTMQESESGPELAYFLGKNPQEAARIAQLSPFLQAKELGRLEAKLAQPPAKQPSSAPAPINPVKPGGSGFVDTTDPRSLEKMGTSAWIAAERQRQAQRLKAH